MAQRSALEQQYGAGMFTVQAPLPLVVERFAGFQISDPKVDQRERTYTMNGEGLRGTLIATQAPNGTFINKLTLNASVTTNGEPLFVTLAALTTFAFHCFDVDSWKPESKGKSWQEAVLRQTATRNSPQDTYKWTYNDAGLQATLLAEPSEEMLSVTFEIQAKDTLQPNARQWIRACTFGKQALLQTFK
ncbi:hypothetical protein [Deinococcus yavapaiensis]|nr:hypothetical protein [Deinococcus yavapaiensis]